MSEPNAEIQIERENEEIIRGTFSIFKKLGRFSFRAWAKKNKGLLILLVPFLPAGLWDSTQDFKWFRHTKTALLHDEQAAQERRADWAKRRQEDSIFKAYMRGEITQIKQVAVRTEGKVDRGIQIIREMDGSKAALKRLEAKEKKRVADSIENARYMGAVGKGFQSLRSNGIGGYIPDPPNQF